MNLGIIGANGTIGSRILNEALRRGHNVTAFVRDASRIPAEPGKVTWKVADDGSTGGTRQVVDEFKARAQFPVSHVWHEDQGFRAAAIRNRS